MKKHKEYLERDDLKNATHLQISIYYTKGGTSLWGGGAIRRGYYLMVTPVTKSENSISFTAFTGYSHLLLETQRYTDKQFDRAVEIAEEHKETLIATVVEKNKAA